MFRRKYTRIHVYIDCIQSIGVHTFTEMCTYMGIHIHNYLHLSPMGWLRLVGSLKLYAFFAREPYKGTSILQKRPTMLRSLPIVATPYRYLYICKHSPHNTNTESPESDSDICTCKYIVVHVHMCVCMYTGIHE